MNFKKVVCGLMAICLMCGSFVSCGEDEGSSKSKKKSSSVAESDNAEDNSSEDTEETSQDSEIESDEVTEAETEEEQSFIKVEANTINGEPFEDNPYFDVLDQAVLTDAGWSSTLIVKVQAKKTCPYIMYVFDTEGVLSENYISNGYSSSDCYLIEGEVNYLRFDLRVDVSDLQLGYVGFECTESKKIGPLDPIEIISWKVGEEYLEIKLHKTADDILYTNIPLCKVIRYKDGQIVCVDEITLPNKFEQKEYLVDDEMMFGDVETVNVPLYSGLEFDDLELIYQPCNNVSTVSDDSHSFLFSFLRDNGIY